MIQPGDGLRRTLVIQDGLNLAGICRPAPFTDKTYVRYGYVKQPF